MFVTNLTLLPLYNRGFKLIATIVIMLSGSMVFSLSAAAAIQIAPREGQDALTAPSREHSGLIQEAPPVTSHKHNGSIVGKVNDASGKAVAKTTIRLTDSVTQEVSTYESGKNGEYQIINLEPGVYTLQAEAGGRQSDLTQVKVSNNAVTRQNLKVESKK